MKIGRLDARKPFALDDVKIPDKAFMSQPWNGHVAAALMRAANVVVQGEEIK